MLTSMAVAAESLCSTDEHVVFSCAVGKGTKTVSLCASRVLTEKNGALYYRFGSPANFELEYPNKPNGSAQKFLFAHYSRYQTERTEVAFSIGNFAYAVFDYYEESEKQKYTRGVRVTSEGTSKETNLMCKAPVISKLQQLEGKVPCDSNSALAQCN